MIVATFDRVDNKMLMMRVNVRKRPLYGIIVVSI